MRSFLRFAAAPLAFCAAVAIVSPGCSRAREYELKGQVLAVDPARREITIKHGDIKGFMPGMTMPFTVKDPRLLEGRVAGDLVTATLVVRDANAYLSTIDKTGHSELSEPPPAVHALDVLREGAEVPDVEFVDETGARRRLSDWQGHTLAVTFIYTRCPLPDFCPLMDRNFAEVQRKVLENDSLAQRVRLLSVSFDPEHDTPAVLLDHARRAGADPRVWHFATGDLEKIAGFAEDFGVSVMRNGDDPGNIVHNLRTAVIGPDRRLITVLGGNEWKPADLLNALVQARD